VSRSTDVPEAPFTLLLPLAALIVVAIWVARRRRAADQA
jgi:hypothetical protein